METQRPRGPIDMITGLLKICQDSPGPSSIVLTGHIQKLSIACQSLKSHSTDVQGFCRGLIRGNFSCSFELNHGQKNVSYWALSQPSLTLCPCFPRRHLKTFSAKQRRVLRSTFCHIVKQFKFGWAQLFWSDFIVPHCWVGISTPVSCQENPNASCKRKVLQTIINVSRHINWVVEGETDKLWK